MLERLEVHGKVYEPISVVAEAVSYTAEELAQLVQDKLVPAAMIESVWFVDRAAVLELQKTTPSDRQKRKRTTQKINRADAVKAVYATRVEAPPPHPLVTTMQATTILACGLLVGSLLYWSEQAGVDVVALQAGAIQAGVMFVEGVEPVWSTWRDLGITDWYATE